MVNDKIIYELEKICRVEAVSGNNDFMLPEGKYPVYKDIVINGNIKIYVVHDIHDIQNSIDDYDLIISGHTHKPVKKYINDTLFLNPGSFGPVRFSLPISLATVDIVENKFEVQFHEL